MSTPKLFSPIQPFPHPVRRRNWLTVGLLLLCLVVGGVLLLPFRSGPGPVNLDNFIKIKAGMSPVEVQAILGGPPNGRADGATPGLGSRVAQWVGDQAIILVYFDADSKVTTAEFQDKLQTGYERIDLLQR